LAKKIWDISGDPGLNYLRPEDFHVAMRLIAMAQASPGLPISVERLISESGSPLPLARMQNVPPPPPGCISQGTHRVGGAPVAHEPLSAMDPFVMSGQERSKYEALFPVYDSDRDGFVTGTEAVELFSKSRLPREHLRQIWQLADADGDSKLSLAEFCVGMHLIVCVSKKGLPCPATLPRSLLAVLATTSGAVTSPSTPVPLSPVERASLALQAPSSPPSAMLSLVPGASGSEDAFSALAVDLPKSNRASSVGGEAGLTTPVPEQDSPAKEPPLQPAQVKNHEALRSSTDTSVSENDISTGDSTIAGTQELAAAASALLVVTRDVSNAHKQGRVAHSSSVESMRALVENLRAENTTLCSLVEDGRVEHMDNERQLRDMGAELENLSLDLSRLRKELKDQRKESNKLRTRITQTAAKRATLRAEVKACDSLLQERKEDNAFLREDVLGEEAIEEERGASQTSAAVAESPSSLAGQIAENLHISSAAEEIGAMREGTPEPVMPTNTPPAPPQAMVPQPSAEDPFAAVVGDKGSQTAGNTSCGSDPQRFISLEGQAGFDAFPSAGGDGFENGTDPFATSGLDEDEEPEDDPFTATDAVFTNATAAADGFDAFPTDTQPFDAFVQ
ncbi:unnamed protein product, partial [Scytosiphon promiscuus]